MYSPWRKLILNKVSTHLHSTTAHPAINPFNKQENMVYIVGLLTKPCNSQNYKK